MVKRGTVILSHNNTIFLRKQGKEFSVNPNNRKNSL